MMMAKNEKYSTVAMAAPDGAVSYMRKDGIMLVGGTWYVTAPCPALLAGLECLAGMPDEAIDRENGLVTHEVPWARAKTPHHAGTIPERLHAPCQDAANAGPLRRAALAEIAAAESLLAQQRVNLAAAQQRLDQTDAANEEMIAAAQVHLRKHEEGLVNAERRVCDVRRDNAPE